MLEEGFFADWDQLPLASVFRINTASAFPAQSPNETFVHYSIPAFDELGGPAEELGASIESNKTRISEPSVLVSKLNPRKPRVVAVLDPQDKTCCSTEFICYVPVRDNDDLRYWAVYLGSGDFSKRLERVAVGSTNSHTRATPSETLRWLVPDTPPGEQKLIADILDAIDNAILETDAVIEKLSKIRLGLIEDLLTHGLLDDGSPRAGSDLINDPLGLRPKSWDRGTLSDFYAEPSRNGLYKPAQFHGRGPKMAQMGSIFSNIEVDLEDAGRVAVSQSEYDRFSLKEGDLLFGRRSLVLEGAGKSAIVRNLDEKATFESSIVRVRLDSKRILPEYAILYLSTPRAYLERLKFIRQVAVSGVSGSDIADSPILCPPLDEQERIVERDASIAERIRSEVARLDKFKSTREGLRDDLRTGRKRVAARREAEE